MKLLIEDYQYEAKDVVDVLEGLFTLQDIENKISVSYVGYYFNPKVKDCVFILPKVLIDEKGKAFGKYDPAELVNLDEAKLDQNELKFLYEFAVWIHRAIVVFRNDHPKNDIVLQKEIESEGHGRKKKSNTLLDIILAMLRFNKENRQFFTFILKNIHSGFNKINWGKTISRTTAMVEGDDALYLRPVNKKREVNIDEELIVIFFSILKYITEKFGFCAEIPFGFKLITGNQFERYINGLGCRRLRQIKYKYFSDIAIQLWQLCYAFFDKAYQIKMSVSPSEYLLVKSFHIVFEAIIEELIGDKDVPAGLKEQDDGKLVDHFYTYDALISDREKNNDVYYIGDSKYYKIGSNPGRESVYKQYTYARNVIQWNLNLFLPPEKGATEKQLEARRKDKGRFGKIRLRDNVTEGYNVIPNFFISAKINPETLSYEDQTEPHPTQPPISRQFQNRLYDRDTLLLSHYDVNFLFVIALYARNNAGAKDDYRQTVRGKFREAIQKMLKEHFKFYAMQARPGVDAEQYLKANFHDTLGKTFRPFANDEIFSLALDFEDSDNQTLLDKLGENFYVVECPLGEEPTGFIEEYKAKAGGASSIAKGGKYLTCLVRKNETGEDSRHNVSKLYDAFFNRAAEGKTYIMLNMPSGDISAARYLLPIVDNTLIGYYDIESLGFGTNKRIVKGATEPVSFPTLRIKIGAYHELPVRIIEGVVPRMANQIWDASQVKKLMEKNIGYDVETESAEVVSEPEVSYGTSVEEPWPNDYDYIE